MMRNAITALTLILLLLPGCAKEKQAEEPCYSGKVEVLRDGVPSASRAYAFMLHQLDVAPARLRTFHCVNKGAKVAVLRVYWPTFGLEKKLSEAVGKQATQRIARQMGDVLEKQTGKRVNVDVSLSMAITSDYTLIRNDGDRYSLLERGLDDGEHYGYYANSDGDAIDIALNYLTQFVVPMETGSRVYEFKQLKEKEGARSVPVAEGE
jgi:hypothetical protein